MLSMPSASPSRSLRAGLLALLAAAAVGVVPALALADTPPVDVDAANERAPQPSTDPADSYEDTDPSALNDFRDTLDPHGAWTQDPTYGTIWVPNQAEVGPDFAPYQTSGHWAVNDTDDWMWVSDYDWGYVPFHYGRWVWAGSTWGWIPGRTYAPAWVTWRVGDGGYLGWAPLPPSYYWANGVAVGLWTVPYAAYCFVPTGSVFYGNVGRYVVHDRGMVQTAAASTRPYHAAAPSVGGHGVTGSHAPMHMSPSFAAAHIPAGSEPQRRTATDARAASYATRSSTATAHRASMLPRPAQAGTTAQRGNAWGRSYDGFGRSTSTGSRTLGEGGRSGGSYGSSAGSYERGGSSGYHGRPSFEVTSPHGSPSYANYGHMPTGHAPAYHAPSTSHGASTARPAARSGGGFRGGGGHHR